MIDVISSFLNTVNLHLKIKAWLFFFFYHIQFLYVDSEFKKLTTETGKWIWKTPFTLGVEMSCKSCDLAASEWTKGRVNYVCCLAIVTWRKKKVGDFQSSRRAKGKSHEKGEFMRRGGGHKNYSWSWSLN